MHDAFPACLRDAARTARDTGRLLLTRTGPARSPGKLERDAERYWAAGAGDQWRNNSHWRDGSQFSSTGLWETTGQEHLDLYQRLRRASAGHPAPVERIVDWGCGGGANAVAFAPLATGITGVDINAESVRECARQVAEATAIPFTGVITSAGQPEQAAAGIARPVSLFLCLYVLELVPSKEHGLRLMKVAHDLLIPGGQAFVQVKYSDGSWRTRPRRRGYKTALADLTWRVEEFWTAMETAGFRPEAVALVPRNELDERYAYFLLTRR